MLLGVDVGGTFTDAVLVGAGRGDRTPRRSPPRPPSSRSACCGRCGLVLERAGARPQEVERFAHGMTVATNALLEGRTARTALIATAGFTDVIELGRQNRPHLYRLCEAAPAPLVPAELRFGAPERMGPEGPLKALEPAAARALVESLRPAAPEAVAVSLLHSYVDPAHELSIGELLARAAARRRAVAVQRPGGDLPRVRADRHDRARRGPLPAARLLPVEPLLCEAAETGLSEPQIMQSSGGLTDPQRAGEHAALTVLSGPAGGVVGGAAARRPGGGARRRSASTWAGTSCDVCLIESSQVPETAERVIAGRPVALPALDIHTVGAGGGSIAWRDPGGALRVGPVSAGAEPGPACYGRGGQRPTVTDANLLLGRLLADAPLAGGLRLDRRCGRARRGRLALELGLEPLACAEGIVRVAEAEMLGALRLMTVERGIDPRAFALMPFGGAGPLHAAALADEPGHLARARARAPRGCSRALGLAAAAPRRDAARTVLLRGDSLTAATLEREREALLGEACGALGGAGAARAAAPRASLPRTVLRAARRGRSRAGRRRARGRDRPSCGRPSTRAHERALRLPRRAERARAGQHPRLGLGSGALAAPPPAHGAPGRCGETAPDRASTASACRPR